MHTIKVLAGGFLLLGIFLVSERVTCARDADPTVSRSAAISQSG